MQLVKQQRNSKVTKVVFSNLWNVPQYAESEWVYCQVVMRLQGMCPGERCRTLPNINTKHEQQQGRTVQYLRVNESGCSVIVTRCAS